MRSPGAMLLAVALLASTASCGTYEFPVDRPTSAPSDASPSPTLDTLARADVVGRHLVVGAAGAYLDLDADGSARGVDGCNEFGGAAWRLDDGRVELSGHVTTTLRECLMKASVPELGAATRLLPRADGGLDALVDSGRRVAILGPAR